MVPHLLESLLHWALVAYKGKSNNALFHHQGFPMTKVFHSKSFTPNLILCETSPTCWQSFLSVSDPHIFTHKFYSYLLTLPYLTSHHLTHSFILVHHPLFSQFPSLSLPKWTKYQSKISCIQFPSLPFTTDVCVGNPPHYNNTFPNQHLIYYYTIITLK